MLLLGTNFLKNIVSKLLSAQSLTILDKLEKDSKQLRLGLSFCHSNHLCEHGKEHIVLVPNFGPLKLLGYGQKLLNEWNWL